MAGHGNRGPWRTARLRVWRGGDRNPLTFQHSFHFVCQTRLHVNLIKIANTWWARAQTYHLFKCPVFSSPGQILLVMAF